MIKFIVTTTINSPTKATLKFCEIADKKNLKFVIVGDKKTPHDEYRKLEKNFKNVVYLSPEEQENLFPKISEIIGWNTIQRRNIGFIYAYTNQAEIVATVDDDNIPYDFWGDQIYVGQKITVDLYENINCSYFDPLSITNHNDLWHRGFPIEHLKVKNDIEYKGKIEIVPLVQAEFWDGDPDVDAICRLSKKPIVKFEKFDPFTAYQMTPYNSQNTFLHRSVLKNYSVLPFIGRMDDIWGAYIQQFYHPNSVIFTSASVYQERNPQDLIRNLENEIIGYRNTLKLIDNIHNFTDYLPENTNLYFEEYRTYFD